MSLAERRSPFDPAPDWIDQTYGQRVSSALYTLRLFGFLSEKEAATIATRIDGWIDRRVENRCGGLEKEEYYADNYTKIL